MQLTYKLIILSSIWNNTNGFCTLERIFIYKSTTWKRNDFIMNHSSKILTIFDSTYQKITALPGISIAVIAGKLVIPRGKAAWLRKVHVVKIPSVCRTSMSTSALTISNGPRNFISPLFSNCFNIETNNIPFIILMSLVIFI